METKFDAVAVLREALQGLINTPHSYSSGQEYWAECKRREDYARAEKAMRDTDAIAATSQIEDEGNAERAAIQPAWEAVHQWRQKYDGAPWHDAAQEVAYHRVDEQYEARTLYAAPAIQQDVLPYIPEQLRTRTSASKVRAAMEHDAKAERATTAAKDSERSSTAARTYCHACDMDVSKNCGASECNVPKPALAPAAPSGSIGEDKQFRVWLTHGLYAKSTEREITAYIDTIIQGARASQMEAAPRNAAAPCLPERAPEGWKLVPVKITDEMKRAFWMKREERPLLDLNECYSASIAAAPDRPALCEIEIAREDQAARVMPLIGPMLDALEVLPNDTRGALEEDADALFNCLAAIQNAVENDFAAPTPGAK